MDCAGVQQTFAEPLAFPSKLTAQAPGICLNKRPLIDPFNQFRSIFLKTEITLGMGKDRYDFIQADTEQDIGKVRRQLVKRRFNQQIALSAAD